MDIAGAGASAALTGPFHNEVWGGDYDGVYLVKACAMRQVVEYARYHVDGIICKEPPPLPPPPSPTLAPPQSLPPSNDVLLADDITNGTSPMDLYALRASCEEMVGCIWFKMQSTGCVHWILGKDTSSCAAASRRTPDPLWTPPESGAGYFMAGVDEAVVALADDDAPASAEHASGVTIGVVAALSYTSPTLSISLRGAFYYRTCDKYQARLVGKVAIMPVGGSSDEIAIFTVGATMGCATEDRTRVYRVFGTVSDFAVIAGVTVHSAVANATIAEYLNSSVALNGTFAGAAVIDGDVEGLGGFDLSDSSVTVSVGFAKRPGGCSRSRGCGCSSSWTSSTTTPTCLRRRLDPLRPPPRRVACIVTSAGTPTLAIARCRRPSQAPAWPTCTCGAAPTSRIRARRASGNSSRRMSRCASTPSIWPGSSPP